jgi:PAS domain S-box-containing protein
MGPVTRFAGCAAGLAIAAAATLAAEDDTPSTRHVLLLHQIGVGNPGVARFDAAFVEEVRRDAPAPIEVDTETIQTGGLESTDQSRLAIEYLRTKYADRPIDVIVAVGSVPLDFARQNRAIFSHPPIVAVAAVPEQLDRNDNITGLHGGLWISGTIDLALALRPDTRHVVVVDGARADARDLEAEISRQLRERSHTVGVEYLRDLPIPDLVKRIAAVPESSIVLFVQQTARAGVKVDQFDALARVVRAARVPVFSQFEDFMGRGVVGGHVWQWEANARRMAGMVKRIVSGASARDIPTARSSYTNLLDWQQLQRWQIPESRVPAGSIALFRRASSFDQWGYVFGGLLIFAAQLALIVGLLAQRVRRRRAERESRESEVRYRSVVDTQSDLICRFLPDSTLTFVNDAYCRFWNKTRDELLGTKFITLVPPEARHAVLDRIEKISSGLDSHEHQVTLADGTIGWHHWINHPIRDEHGRLIEFQGVGRDITDRKRAEASIGQLEARNSAILRAIPDLMFVLLRDGTFVDYHARDPGTLLVPPEQFMGRTIHDVLPPAVAELIGDALERVGDGEDPVVVEYELPLGGPRRFEARLVSAEHDRVLTIVREVTEAKRALELNRELAGRLITSQEAERTRIARELHDGVCQDIAAVSVDMSHLRQVGGDLRGAAAQEQLLSLQYRTAGVAEALRLISHGLHPSVLHHIGLVAALQAHCAEVERQHRVHVRFHAAGGIEPVGSPVALSLFRIAQEALRNAAIHGHATQASLSLARLEATLVLTVTDDGQGFDPGAARRQGGLGLVSIEERARLVRGEVAIRSQPGHGTSVEVRVPVEARGPDPGQESEPLEDVLTPANAPGRR